MRHNTLIIAIIFLLCFVDSFSSNSLVDVELQELRMSGCVCWCYYYVTKSQMRLLQEKRVPA